MSTRGNVVGSLLVIGGVLVAMTGCTNAGSNYSDLDREPSAADELPLSLQDDEGLGTVELDTVRSIGSHEGTSLWIAEATMPDEVCLIAVRDERAYQVACGSTFTLDGPAGSFIVFPDTGGTPDGATATISKNVYAGAS